MKFYYQKKQNCDTMHLEKSKIALSLLHWKLSFIKSRFVMNMIQSHKIRLGEVSNSHVSWKTKSLQFPGTWDLKETRKIAALWTGLSSLHQWGPSGKVLCFLEEKNFWRKTKSGGEKIQAQKKFWPEKISGKKKFWRRRKILAVDRCHLEGGCWQVAGGRW